MNYFNNKHSEWYLNKDILEEIIKYCNIETKMMLVMVNKSFYNYIWQKSVQIGINKVVFFVRSKRKDEILFFVNNGKRYCNINIFKDLNGIINKMGDVDYYISFNIYFYDCDNVFFILTKIFGSYFVEQDKRFGKRRYGDYNYIDALMNVRVGKTNREKYKPESKHYKEKNKKILKEIINIMNYVIPIGTVGTYLKYNTYTNHRYNLLKREDYIIDIQKYERRKEEDNKLIIRRK